MFRKHVRQVGQGCTRRNARLWVLILLGLLSLSAPAYSATTLFQWRQVASALEGRSEAQGAVVGTKLYVFGGYERVADGSLDAFRDTQVYDPATNTWQLKTPMPEAITHAAIVVDGATIWLLGGYLGDVPHPSTNHVWKYNTNTNS